jgi:endonuclease-8
MPEGDTVWQTAVALRTALAGKTLTRCDIRVPQYAAVDLTGQRIDEVASRGKHLFIRVGSASIHSHLKMDGRWRISDTPSRAGHRIRIILEAGGTHATGIDLGTLEVLDRQRDQEAVAHLGPDLLGEDWDEQLAAANLAADPDRPLADALLDQRVVAGIGNVYCNELCFVVGRRPTAAVRTLPDPLRLARLAREMLWSNRSRWNRCTTGDTRRGRELWVYDRAGKPCRRCGAAIRKDTGTPTPQTTDRVAYWCSSCQTG